MKKIFLLFLILTLSLLLGVYTLLFTSFGNSIVAEQIEKQANSQQTKFKVKVDKFALNTSSIDFLLNVDKNSFIKLKGSFSLFDKVLDLNYDVKVKDLNKLEKLIKQKFNGSFNTEGIIKGPLNKLLIKGSSDFARSDTNYELTLNDFEAENISLDLKNAKLEDLLYFANQKAFTNGLLDINAKIPNAKIETLKGTILTKVSNAKINIPLINKEFKQDIKIPISYNLNINTLLNKNLVNTKTSFNSNILKFNSNKSLYNINNKELQSDYKLEIKQLTKLESLIKTRLNGAFKTQGQVSFKNDTLSINGDSKIAKGLLTYKLKRTKDAQGSFKLNIKDAKIKELLYLVNQKYLAKGNINLDVDLTNIHPQKLEGVITSNIQKGFVNNSIVNKEFNLKLNKSFIFKEESKSVIKNSLVNTKITLLSSKANIYVKDAIFNLKNLSLNSDYQVIVSDLSKLYDLTNTKMRGKLELTGKVEKNKDLIINGNTKSLGGNVDFILKNNDFNAKINDLQVKDLLHTMYYPEILDSTTALNLDYNLLSKQGLLTGNLINGRLQKNKFSSLVNNLARFDLTKEVYENINIKTKINNLVLKSTVNMKSKLTQIDIYPSTLDLENKKIDALVNAKINTTTFPFKIKGDLNKPKISFKGKDILKNKLKKNINKNKDRIKKELNRVLKDKLDDKNTEDLIKSFKSLF